MVQRNMPPLIVIVRATTATTARGLWQHGALQQPATRPTSTTSYCTEVHESPLMAIQGAPFVLTEINQIFRFEEYTGLLIND